MELALPDFANAAIWVSLLTLTFLEIVLGIDNIIFISIVSGKLPAGQQRAARNIGLSLAMLFRVGLLLSIKWIISFDEPVVELPTFNGAGESLALSIKDLILMAGGLFLIVKSTLEIHHKLKHTGESKPAKTGKIAGFGSVIFQVVMVDAVFSFDSILTAVGLVDNVSIMIIAVIVSIIIMMLFAGPVTKIINAYPTLQMLALSFLVVIGVVLIAASVHEEISKSIVYSCLAFSIAVEILNIKLRKKTGKVAGKASSL